MATEPQRSENMPGAPSSSEFASPLPEQTDFSSDAALITAALGRMEAVVRDERAAFDRLRAMLGEMAEAVARAKTVADSETATTLLDELEHRVDAMMEIAGPRAVAASAAGSYPQPASSAARIEHDAALLAHGTSEAQHADAALDADAVEQAIQHPAETDQVPTVSDVVSRLGSDSDEVTSPAAADIPPVEATGVGAPTVAMLTAMVEALRDSISAAAPEAKAAAEIAAAQAAEAVAQPVDTAPQLETSSIEVTMVTTLTAEITGAVEAAHGSIHGATHGATHGTTHETAHQTAHVIEAPQAGDAAQAVEAEHAIEVAEATDILPAADAAPEEGPTVAMLTTAVAAPEPEALIEAPQPTAQAAEVVAQPWDLAPQAMAPQHLAPQDLAPQDLAPQDLAPQDLAPPSETSSIEMAEVAPPAAEIAQPAEAAHIIAAPQAGEVPQAVETTPAVEVAETADIRPPAVAVLDQSQFIAMLNARLEALKAAAAAAAVVHETAIEAPQPAARADEEVVAPPLGVAPPSETSSIEIAEVATPVAEIAQAAYQAAEAAHEIEAPQAGEPAQAVEATPAVEMAEAGDISPPADAAPSKAATVAMLTAKLAALRAAATAAALAPVDLIEAPQPAPEAAEVVAQPQDLAPRTAPRDLAPQDLAPQNLAPQPQPSSIEIAELATPAAETAQASDHPTHQATEPVHGIAAPQAMEATDTSEAIHAAEVADAAPVPSPIVANPHETALLASLEQMGARPFPPPDEGTAVIFAPKQEFEFLPEFKRDPAALSETAPEPEQPVARQSATEPEAMEHSAVEPATAEPETAETPHGEIVSEVTRALAAEPALSAAEVATGHVERAMQVEPTAEPAATPITAITPELSHAFAPGPALSAAAEAATGDIEPIIPIEPTTESAESAAVAPSAAASAAESAESDFDPADFLFEPEPEPDPAADLLDPAPPAPQLKAAVLPQPEFVAPPPKPAAENPEALPLVEPDQPAQTAPPPGPRDPLHALKAMSENEKIALFS